MPDLLYEKRDHVAVFTMNRPERLNALGGTMMSDLAEALADFNADPEMRAGILTGSGRAFSAGADLKEMNQRNVDRGDRAAYKPFHGSSSLSNGAFGASASCRRHGSSL
jgi:enoyl-CoA hydratase/carnithine racemase